jgi:hypothetical protein
MSDLPAVVIYRLRIRVDVLSDNYNFVCRLTPSVGGSSPSAIMSDLPAMVIDRR